MPKLSSMQIKRTKLHTFAAALGLLGPAVILAPQSGGTVIKRGESVRHAWQSAGDVLIGAAGRYKNEVRKRGQHGQ